MEEQGKEAGAHGGDTEALPERELDKKGNLSAPRNRNLLR